MKNETLRIHVKSSVDLIENEIKILKKEKATDKFIIEETQNVNKERQKQNWDQQNKIKELENENRDLEKKFCELQNRMKKMQRNSASNVGLANKK